MSEVATVEGASFPPRSMAPDVINAFGCPSRSGRVENDRMHFHPPRRAPAAAPPPRLVAAPPPRASLTAAASPSSRATGLPAIAARVYGYTTEHRPPSADEEAADDDAADDAAKKDSCVKRHRGCLAVITELCPHGNLEDFMVAEGAPLSPAVKLDVMLQVAEGLERLKSARVVWRDLKAKNLLVRDAKRGRTGEVVKLTVAFTDWGTAVKLPEEGKRRMTLHGPGTAGYIAPDTRGPTYDYGADMWAFLVWAASMCLRVECVVDCQLEEAIAELKLEKKLAATAGHEEKVDGVLRAFEVRSVHWSPYDRVGVVNADP